MAAVAMGISTMRRRPVRTLLTAITVVLLTFTILTFASFGTSWGVRQTYEGPMSGSPPRILVRNQLWRPILPGLFDTLRGALREEASAVPRYWIAPTAEITTATWVVGASSHSWQTAATSGTKYSFCPFSSATGVISSISRATLSPGITISTPSGSFATPVTSVVRK